MRKLLTMGYFEIKMIYDVSRFLIDSFLKFIFFLLGEVIKSFREGQIVADKIVII